MSNYLMHHGIKGQKWGVENGPPYPLSKPEHDNVIKKGTNFQRISNSKEEGQTGSAYAAYTKIDKAMYSGKFAWSRGALAPDFVKKVYKVNMTAVKDLKGPNEETRHNAYKWLVTHDADFRTDLATYIKEHKHSSKNADLLSTELRNVKDTNQFKNGYFYMTQALGDQSISVQSKYFKLLRNKGYDFVYDDYDMVLGYGYKPVILIDREKSTEYKGADKLGRVESLITGLKTPSNLIK